MHSSVIFRAIVVLPLYRRRVLARRAPGSQHHVCDFVRKFGLFRSRKGCDPRFAEGNFRGPFPSAIASGSDVPAILLDLVRDPREDREARAEESRRPREQEAEQTIAPRRREVERERPPPLEEEALALRVLALERGDERVPGRLSLGARGGEAPLVRVHPERAVDGQRQPGGGDRSADREDLPARHVGLTAIEERAGYRSAWRSPTTRRTSIIARPRRLACAPAPPSRSTRS